MTQPRPPKPYKVKRSSFYPPESATQVWLVQFHIGHGRYHTISRQPSIEKAMAAIERHLARQP